jgi:putative membrane protein
VHLDLAREHLLAEPSETKPWVWAQGWAGVERTGRSKAMYWIRVLIAWLLSGAAFLGVSKILPGFRIRSYGTALMVSAVYSILYIVLHFILFKVLWILTIPVVILTLGIIFFVVNAVILWLTDRIVDDFDIDSTATLLIAAVLLTIVNWIIRVVLFL